MTNLWRSAGTVVRSAAIGLALSGMAMSQALATPSLSQSPDPVVAGNTVTVTLSDVIALVDMIAAVGLQVTFDATKLSFQSFGLGSLLVGWDLGAANSPSSGVELLGASECGLCADASGSGSVVTLTFLALASDPTGTASISVETNPSEIAAPNTYLLSTTPGTINIAAAIPAPGLPLFALPVLFLIRRFKRRA